MNTGDPSTLLVDQIAVLQMLDPVAVELCRLEFNSAQIPWVREYTEYGSGEWWTSSLMNESGDATDVTIRDVAAVPTALLHELPQIAQMLDGLGLDIMWARLARLTANSFLWEHADYGELDDVDRVRLHIPLITNSSARMVLAGSSVQLDAGRVWRLAPVFRHGVCNLYGPDRVHIILDCYVNDSLRASLSGARLDPAQVHKLPRPTADELDAASQKAERLVDLGYEEAAQVSLLRLFFRFELPPGTPYDMISALYDSRGRPEIATSWRAKKAVMLGEQR